MSAVPSSVSSFRRQLVHPGENERRHETQHEPGEQQLVGPSRQAKQAEQQVADLQQHPGRDKVQRRHSKDIATLQFREYGHAARALDQHRAARRDMRGDEQRVIGGDTGAWKGRAFGWRQVRRQGHPRVFGKRDLLGQHAVHGAAERAGMIGSGELAGNPVRKEVRCDRVAGGDLQARGERVVPGVMHDRGVEAMGRHHRRPRRRTASTDAAPGPRRTTATVATRTSRENS